MMYVYDAHTDQIDPQENRSSKNFGESYKACANDACTQSEQWWDCCWGNRAAWPSRGAHKIEAHKTEAHKIEAHKIEAHKMKAQKIEAHQIEARKIEAHKIEAHKIETS